MIAGIAPSRRVTPDEPVQLSRAATDPFSLIEAILSAAREELEVATTVLLYTDGFSEAVNARGEELGTNSWKALVLRHARRAISELPAVLSDEIRRFESGSEPADDKTIIVMRRTR